MAGAEGVLAYQATKGLHHSHMTREELIAHYGQDDELEHVVAIGEASSSLGLLSTLIMAVALNNLLLKNQAAAHLMLVIGNGFAVYTVTFSVLEWHSYMFILPPGRRGLEGVGAWLVTKSLR